MTFKKTTLFLITSMFVGSTWAQVTPDAATEPNANANPSITIQEASPPPAAVPPVVNPSVTETRVDGSSVDAVNLKQPEKMESCNAKADAKGKTGNEREQYMQTCLSNK